MKRPKDDSLEERKKKKTKYFFVDQEGLKMNFVQVMHIDGRKEHISLHVKTFIVHSFPMA